MQAVVLLFIHLAIGFAYTQSNHPYSKNELKTKVVDNRWNDWEDAIILWLQMQQLDPLHLRLKEQTQGRNHHQNNLDLLSHNLIDKIIKYGVGSYVEYEMKFNNNEDTKKHDVHKQTSNKQKAIESSEDDEGKLNLEFNGFKHPTETQTKHLTMSDNDYNMSNENDEYSSDEDVDIKIIYLTTPKPSSTANLDDYEEYFEILSPTKNEEENHHQTEVLDNFMLKEYGNMYFKNGIPAWLRVKKNRCKDKSMRQCVGDENVKEEKKEEKKEKKVEEKKIEHDKNAEFYANSPRVTVRPPWNGEEYFFRTGLQKCEPGSLNLANFKPYASCKVCFCDLNGKINCKIDEICKKQSIRSRTELPPFCDDKMCFRQCLLTKMRAGVCREDSCTCL